MCAHGSGLAHPAVVLFMERALVTHREESGPCLLYTSDAADDPRVV